MIDLTLDSLLVPAIEGYIPAVGKKIERTAANKGGLSTREVAENIALPFIKQRAVNVAVSDETSAIEYDASLIVTGEDVTVTVNNATAPGIEIEIFCTADSKVVINNRAPENMFAGNSYKFFWTGTKWRVSDGVMTGDYVARSSERIPVGYLAADGQKISEEYYPELYAEIGDMYQPAGTDKIIGSFYLPDFKNRIPQGAAGNIGTYIEAGLPNITGSIPGTVLDNRYAGSGCFAGSYAGSGPIRDDSSGNTRRGSVIYFSAANGNSIYGKSNTVQPPAICCNYLIKY